MQTYIPMARRRRPLPRTIYSEAQSKAAHSGSGRCRPHVPFGWAATDAVRFVKYGICTATPDQDVNPNFTSFDLSANQLSDCTLSFMDNQNPASLYFFKITKQPPYPSRPPDGQPIPGGNKTMIDCSGNTQFVTDTWCQNIFGYTQAAVGQHKREDDYISV